MTHIARDLGISDTSIHQWRKELAEHNQEAFPGRGHQTAEVEEVRRLKRELEIVKQERDRVKKALGIFSRSYESSRIFLAPERSYNACETSGNNEDRRLFELYKRCFTGFSKIRYRWRTL